MKTLGLAVLAGMLATPTFACDLCAVYSANEAEGGSGRGWMGGVAEQFTHFGTLQDTGHKVVGALPTDGKYIDSSVTQIFAGYNFNNRFGVQLNVPLISRTFGTSVDHGNESGLGDISLIGNFRIYKKSEDNYNFTWSALGGIKLPSGDSHPLGEPDFAPGIGGHDTALGSGSTDGIIGTSVSARWKRAMFNAGVQYAIRTEGDFQHQYANDLTWSGGPGVYLALKEDYTLTLQAIVSGETKGQDTLAGVQDPDSAETMVYVGPQFNFTWKSKLSAQAGVDLPVYRYNSGTTLVPDYRVHVAFTWRF